MKGAERVRRYVRFFFERAHGVRFFGGKMLAYAGAVLALCLVALLFREGLEGVAAVFKGCAAAVLVVAQCQALAALLAGRLSVAHNDHVSYLGFTPADQGLLACMVALPANAALALLVGIVFAGTFSLVVCVGLSLAVFFLMECLCPVLLRAGGRAASKRRVRRGSARDIRVAARAFGGPCRALLAKDLRGFKASEGAALVALLPVALLPVGLLVMVVSGGFEGLHVFTFCLYLGVLMPAFACSLLLFSGEVEAYHRYYVPLLQVGDGTLLAGKLPLQVVVVLVFTGVLALFDGVLHGFEPTRFLVAFGLAGYFVVFSLAMDWLHLVRIKEHKVFDSLYELALLPVAAVPGLPIACAVIARVRMVSQGCPSRRVESSGGREHA